MFPIRILAFGVLLPAVVAGFVLFVAWRRSLFTMNGKWSGAVAFTLGYLIAHFAAFGMPSFPPTDATQWLAYLAVAAMVVGLVESFWQAPSWARWFWRWGFSGLVLWLLLRSVVEYTWGLPKGLVWLLALSIVMLMFWTALDALAERIKGAFLPALLFITSLGSSIALMLGRSASISQLCGSVTVMTIVSAIVGWQQHNFTLAKGAAAVLTVLLFGFWLNGVFYAYLPMVTAVLLMLSPMVGWLGQMPPMRRLPAWQSVFVQILAALLLVVVANIIAVRLMGLPTTLLGGE